MLTFARCTTHVMTRNRIGAADAVARNAVAAILTPADILLDLEVPTKQRALEEIACFVGARNGIPESEVCASLVQREQVGSTALCYGVAIPHARVNGISRAIAAFVRTRFPIPFDAPDGKPVSEMLVLLVPKQATEVHLALLAQAAEMFSDSAFRESLRMCVDGTGVHAAISQWPWM